MNGTHQVLTYAYDVNLIGDNIRTIERNANVLLNTCKDIKTISVDELAKTSPVNPPTSA